MFQTTWKKKERVLMKEKNEPTLKKKNWGIEGVGKNHRENRGTSIKKGKIRDNSTGVKKSQRNVFYLGCWPKSKQSFRFTGKEEQWAFGGKYRNKPQRQMLLGSDTYWGG